MDLKPGQVVYVSDTARAVVDRIIDDAIVCCKIYTADGDQIGNLAWEVVDERLGEQLDQLGQATEHYAQKAREKAAAPVIGGGLVIGG